MGSVDSSINTGSRLQGSGSSIATAFVTTRYQYFIYDAWPININDDVGLPESLSSVTVITGEIFQHWAFRNGVRGERVISSFRSSSRGRRFPPIGTGYWLTDARAGYRLDRSFRSRLPPGHWYRFVITLSSPSAWSTTGYQNTTGQISSTVGSTGHRALRVGLLVIGSTPSFFQASPLGWNLTDN